MKRLLLILLCVGLPTQAFAQGTPPVRVTDAGVGSPTDAAAGVDANGSVIAQLRQAVIEFNAAVTALGGVLEMDVVALDGASLVYDPCGDPAKILTLDVNDAAGTSSEQLLDLDGSDIVYICGYTITADDVALVTLQFGDGTACSTNTVTWERFYAGSAGSGMVRPITGVRQKQSAAGMQICVTRGADVALYGSIDYVQEPAP
jgi:hypothetical protein